MKTDTELINLLAKNKETIAIAESCTGGYIANRVTNISGSSKVFKSGFIVYSNEAKIRDLNLKIETLEKYGSVSAEVVEELALNLLNKTKVTIAIAISGIAPPSDLKSNKEIGLVFIALATNSSSNHWKYLAKAKTREKYKEEVSDYVFNLIENLLKNSQEI